MRDEKKLDALFIAVVNIVEVSLSIGICVNHSHLQRRNMLLADACGSRTARPAADVAGPLCVCAHSCAPPCCAPASPRLSWQKWPSAAKRGKMARSWIWGNGCANRRLLLAGQRIVGARCVGHFVRVVGGLPVQTNTKTGTSGKQHRVCRCRRLRAQVSRKKEFVPPVSSAVSSGAWAKPAPKQASAATELVVSPDDPHGQILRRPSIRAST